MKNLQNNLHKIQNNAMQIPNLRFVRYLTLTSESAYGYGVPLDSRLFYAADGKGEIEVADDLYKMDVGSCVVIPQGVPYKLVSPEHRVTYIAVNFDFSQKSRASVTPVPPAEPKSYSRDMLVPDDFDGVPEVFRNTVYADKMREAEGILININYEFSRHMEYFETVSGAMFLHVLILLARRNNLQRNSCSRRAADEIVNYIHENFDKKITNKSVGDIFGFNSHYVSDMIKNSTGMALHKYLLHVRLSNAISCIESQKYTLSEIAVMCGFGDIYYFSRHFKRETGVSPSEYFKRNLR